MARMHWEEIRWTGLQIYTQVNLETFFCFCFFLTSRTSVLTNALDHLQQSFQREPNFLGCFAIELGRGFHTIINSSRATCGSSCAPLTGIVCVWAQCGTVLESFTKLLPYQNLHFSSLAQAFGSGLWLLWTFNHYYYYFCELLCISYWLLFYKIQLVWMCFSSRFVHFYFFENTLVLVLQLVFFYFFIIVQDLKKRGWRSLTIV